MGMGRAGWEGGGARVGGGVDCWALTALATSSSQRSASDGVLLCPPLWTVMGGGDWIGGSACTQEEVAGRERNRK